MPFLAAGGFVALIAVAEAVLLATGMSLGALAGHDADTASAVPEKPDLGDAHGLLAWLGLGWVPLSAFLVTLAACYSIAGFALQALALGSLGSSLP